MVLTEKSRRSPAYDPAFRALLGEQFDGLSDDELAVFLDTVMTATMVAVEELAAAVPVVEGLYIKV